MELEKKDVWEYLAGAKKVLVGIGGEWRADRVPGIAGAYEALAGILAGVAVYGILVIALRILRAEDLRAVPHGEKIIKILHLKG